MKILIGLAGLLVAGHLWSAEVPPTVSGKVNPCPEGAFLDLGENQCKTLDKAFGFNRTQFNAAHKTLVINLANCTNSVFKTAVQDLDNNGGGTLNIPACDLKLTEKIYIPGNTLIQGMGTDKTRIHIDSGFPNDAVLTMDVGDKNFILRDLKIEGIKGGVTRTVIGLLVSKVQNVLLERLAVTAMSKSAILHPKSQYVTARYINTYNNAEHGIGAKDCYMSNTGNPGDWTMARCDGGNPDTYWSRDVTYNSIYSHDNRTGMDPHVTELEIAGVYIDNSGPGHGIKVPERAWDVWMHDNVILDSDDQSVTSKSQYCSTMEFAYETRDIAMYRNRIENNNKDRGFAVLYTLNMNIKDNIYRNNGSNNEWTAHSSCATSTALANSTVFICPGGDITTGNLATGSGTVTNLSAGDSRCDLANVGSIFD